MVLIYKKTRRNPSDLGVLPAQGFFHMQFTCDAGSFAAGSNADSTVYSRSGASGPIYEYVESAPTDRGYILESTYKSFEAYVPQGSGVNSRITHGIYIPCNISDVKVLNWTESVNWTYHWCTRAAGVVLNNEKYVISLTSCNDAAMGYPSYIYLGVYVTKVESFSGQIIQPIKSKLFTQNNSIPYTIN